MDRRYQVHYLPASWCDVVDKHIVLFGVHSLNVFTSLRQRCHCGHDFCHQFDKTYIYTKYSV